MELHQQDRLRIDRIAGVAEGLDRQHDGPIHELQRRGDDPQVMMPETADPAESTDEKLSRMSWVASGNGVSRTVTSVIRPSVPSDPDHQPPEIKAAGIRPLRAHAGHGPVRQHRLDADNVIRRYPVEQAVRPPGVRGEHCLRPSKPLRTPDRERM